MARSSREFVEHILKLRGERQVSELVALYAADAAIVRYEGVARGTEELRAFTTGFLSAHGRFDLVTIDALTECEDVILFDATVETSVGLLQITEVIVLDEHGSIRRHVPGLRGYWGK
jgi:hypothetical protein